MTITQQGLLTLVKSALTGEKLLLPADFSLAEALKIAKKHGITTIVYYGALNCGISSEDAIMQSLFIYTCKNIAVSEQQNFEIEGILKAFDEAQIDYMPLKGTLLKKMYPKPEMRIMGDADILIKVEQYDIIKPIMVDLGYTETVESDHELTWSKGGVCIELHKRLIPSYNKDYYAYYGDGWNLGKIKNGTRFSMTDEDQMIYLFTHFAKHYRDAGIGIRHIIDLWVYKNNNHNLDEDYIENELKKLQLLEFYCNVFETLETWFSGKTSTDVTDFITQIIFNSGVYGESEKHIISEALKKSKTYGSAFNVKLRKYMNLLFPKYINMCKLYPVLEKWKILLPLMWVVRIFKTIIFKRESIKHNNSKVTKITDKEIDSYQEALNFVGLDFNFKEK